MAGRQLRNEFGKKKKRILKLAIMIYSRDYSGISLEGL
jgi:hypothetical protein